MSVSQKLKALSKDSIVYAFPSVLQRSFGLITLPIFSRILAPEDYGVMGMMAAISCFVGMFIPTDWEAAVTLCYHDAANENERRSAVTTWLYFHFTVALVLACGLWLASERIAASFLGSPHAHTLLNFLAGTSLLGTGTWPIAWTLLRIERKKWWVVGILSGHFLLCMILSMLLVAVARQGVQGIYLAGFLSSIPLFFVSVWIVRPWLSPRGFSWRHLRKLVHLGLPYLPMTASIWFIGNLNRFFLEHFHGLGDVGLLSIATSLASGVGVMVLAFQQAWWPFAIALKDHTDGKPVYAQALTSYLLLACGAAAALAMFTPELLSILTPQRYHAAALMVAYTAMTAVGTGVCTIAALGVTLAKKTSFIAWIAMLIAALAVLLNLLLVPSLGITGAALSSLFAQWTSAGLLFVLSQRNYFIAYQWRSAGLILLATIVLIALGAQIETGHWWLTLIVKLCWFSCFPGIILVFRVITTNQLRMLAGWTQPPISAAAAEACNLSVRPVPDHVAEGHPPLGTIESCAAAKG
ncbi:MAG TPA: lipopolysaccharide biosynthesis protein [Gemmataceae bacterium]|nr:lipopolysaccharide biosynthesis protein [Gemmataceae bacterium]